MNWPHGKKEPKHLKRFRADLIAMIMFDLDKMRRKLADGGAPRTAVLLKEAIAAAAKTRDRLYKAAKRSRRK